MAKITRKTQKIFGVNANSNELAVFGSLKAGTPTYSSDPDTIQSAEYLRGLFGAVIGDNSPAIEDHNSLFYLFARQLAYLFQQGIAEWDSATEYHIGSFCSLSTEVGKIYVSRTNTNVNHSPTGTDWQLYWYVFDLNKLEKYTPFCVNSGNTDADGNGDLVSFTGNILSFKIGGSYVNMGLTTAKGSHFEISSITDIDFASAANGTYYFYIDASGTVSYYATALYRQIIAPTTPATNDVWLDTSKELLTCYKWSGTAWVEVQFVPFVKVIKTGGVITAVTTNKYNQNNYNLNINTDIPVGFTKYALENLQSGTLGTSYPTNQKSYIIKMSFGAVSSSNLPVVALSISSDNSNWTVIYQKQIDGIGNGSIVDNYSVADNLYFKVEAIANPGNLTGGFSYSSIKA